MTARRDQRFEHDADRIFMFYDGESAIPRDTAARAAT